LLLRRAPAFGKRIVEFNGLAEQGNVAALVDALSTSDAQRWHHLRGAIASSLGKTKSVVAVPPLVRLVSDRDEKEDVRLFAARALGELGEPSGAPALVEALEDGSERVRIRAVTSLGQIGSSSSVDPMLVALRDRKWGVRMYAAEALGNIPDGRVIDALSDALKDRRRLVRVRAAQALARVGDGRAVEALSGAAKKENLATRGLIAEAERTLRQRLDNAPKGVAEDRDEPVD
jgi:HEAT repeat protein